MNFRMTEADFFACLNFANHDPKASCTALIAWCDAWEAYLKFER